MHHSIKLSIPVQLKYESEKLKIAIRRIAIYRKTNIITSLNSSKYVVDSISHCNIINIIG